MTHQAGVPAPLRGRDAFDGFMSRAAIALGLAVIVWLVWAASASATSPTIGAEYITNAASTSASLGAGIAPNETPVTYYFQYGPSAAYGSEVPAAPGVSISANASETQVTQHVQGLQPSTLYHYRVIVVGESQPGEFTTLDGSDGTFRTQPAGATFALPDGRQWEMVSPPDKHGAPILQPGEMVTQAAANGDAMAYLTQLPTEAEPEGYSQLAQELSRRTARGWESRDIATPHEVASGHSLNQGQEYRLFSEDLETGILQVEGAFNPSLSPEASEQTPYLRTNFAAGDVEAPCQSGCYRPLVTGAPGYANVAPGTVFGLSTSGTEETCRPAPRCGPEFADTTADLQHVVLNSTVPLTSGGSPPSLGNHDLYEWSGGTLTYVGDGRLGSFQSAQGNAGSTEHAISEDGSRVFFTEYMGSELGLFMRDTATGALLRLDTVQNATSEGSAQALFQAASSDGSRVFFTDSQRLTADASSEVYQQSDLYECLITETPTGPHCELTDLTPAASGEVADVLGSVLVSKDGSYVYFVADGLLAPGAVAGKSNLYVHHAGTTKFVAALSPNDAPDWAVSLVNQTARVSPDGRWLAFMSQEDLTGYDTRDAVSGQPDEEVYLYDASSAALMCASCNPTGARPQGVEAGERLIQRPEGGGLGPWPLHAWLAANVPGWSRISGFQSDYQSRYLSDNGRLFFNSSDALAAQDVDGTEDVYEYEPPGAGSCTKSSTDFSERSSGCIDLLSSGTSAEESVFMDASETGGDVFFLTAARLAQQDLDTSLDVYDAHECTTSSPCLAPQPLIPPACDTGDACKPAPTPQPTIYGAPSSATFSGAGNVVPETAKPASVPKTRTRAQKRTAGLRACRKTRAKRSRQKCEKRIRAKYAQLTPAASGSNKSHSKPKKGQR